MIKKRNIVILFFISLLLILLIISIFYFIFEDENISIDYTDNIIDNNEEEILLESGINIEIDGFKYCRNNKLCFEKIFLNCDKGNYIYQLDDEISYSISVINLYEKNCYILIQNLVDKNMNDKNCKIPVEDLNTNLFEKFISSDEESFVAYCK